MAIIKQSLTRQRRALTLLELLVVLVILAVVATVAVNSLQPRIQTSRFDQTRKLLDNIRISVVGESQRQQVDGTPLISGFVSDIGRLPKEASSLASVGTEDSMTLGELWDTQSQLAQKFPFQFRSGPDQPVDLSDIRLPCGWRGPYLHLPLGQKAIVDAWSRPFDHYTDEQMQVQVISWRPLPPFDEPLVSDFSTGRVAVTGMINFGQPQPSKVQVLMLAPDPETSLTHLAVRPDEDSVQNTFTFSEVAVGLRAICVIMDDRQVTKYVQVPHEGLSVVIDLSTDADATP